MAAVGYKNVIYIKLLLTTILWIIHTYIRSIQNLEVQRFAQIETIQNVGATQLTGGGIEVNCIDFPKFKGTRDYLL